MKKLIRREAFGYPVGSQDADFKDKPKIIFENEIRTLATLKGK